ncbi:hypothetical protein BDN71DRAFT_1513904 [Pleurotus eryngii]|uniref:Uncharacterized protein n=1 Tax=Pleurotus eryngii TaxID=5323 RepID=A0A9P5ZHF1_PLEER|nr:hypothetical protein BDN71DRAFT_1513904 [Pleurotus eryngii]
MNDSQVDDDDEGSLADTTAAIYSQSQPSSRRNSISSDMSIENDYDPREPHPHDAKPPTAIEERFLNSIFSNPIPSSFNSTFASSQIEEPAAAQVDDESTASLPALETDDDELLSDTSTTRLNRFRLLRKRAYRFLGKKFNKESIFEPKDTSTTSQAVNPSLTTSIDLTPAILPSKSIKIDRTDKDYDPELCLHPPHGLTTCLRHNLTHAEHYALQESGLSLDDVDNMNMHELREYLQALDTPPPPVSQPPPLPRLTEQELNSVTLRSQSSQMSLSDSLVPPATIEPVNPDSVQVMSVITDTSNSFQLGEPWNSNNLEALRKFVSGLRSTTTPSIRNDIILQPPSEALLRGTQIADGTFRTATPYPTPELELPSKPIDSSWTNITFPPSLIEKPTRPVLKRSGSGYMSIYDSSDYSDSPSPPRTSAETSDNSDSSDNDIITLFPPIQPIAQFHDSQESSVNGFNHPRNTPPNRKYQPTSMFATPNDIAPGELMYELITDAPDPWNYNDATTTVLQLMTVPPMPTTSYPKYISQPPDDHPYWRNNHTKFEHIRSIVKYDGSYDNHPLRTWSNACIELDDYYHINWQEDGDTDLAQMVLDICEAARKGNTFLKLGMQLIAYTPTFVATSKISTRVLPVLRTTPTNHLYQ